MNIPVAKSADKGAVGTVRVSGAHTARIGVSLQENRDQKHPAAYMDKNPPLYTR